MSEKKKIEISGSAILGYYKYFGTCETITSNSYNTNNILSITEQPKLKKPTSKFQKRMEKNMSKRR